jgi:hypothetical protein
MLSESNIKLVIRLADPDLDTDEKDAGIQNLLMQLEDVEGVEVSRVLDPDPPSGNKAMGGFLVDMLTAEVDFASVKNLLSFLGDRLTGKSIELEVEANGKKLKVKANSRTELEAAIKAAQDFIAS